MLGEEQLPDQLDGVSVSPVFNGDRINHPVFCDYLAIGPCVPCRMVRWGDFKLMYTHQHDDQLFNLSEDPYETINLLNDPAAASIQAKLKKAMFESWDPTEVDLRVRASQRRRIAINNASGPQPVWDYVYCEGDDKRFVRNRKVDDTKGRHQLPRINPVAQNRVPMNASQIDAAMQTGQLP